MPEQPPGWTAMRRATCSAFSSRAMSSLTLEAADSVRITGVSSTDSVCGAVVTSLIAGSTLRRPGAKCTHHLLGQQELKSLSVRPMLMKRHSATPLTEERWTMAFQTDTHDPD